MKVTINTALDPSGQGSTSAPDGAKATTESTDATDNAQGGQENSGQIDEQAQTQTDAPEAPEVESAGDGEIETNDDEDEELDEATKAAIRNLHPDVEAALPPDVLKQFRKDQVAMAKLEVELKDSADVLRTFQQYDRAFGDMNQAPNALGIIVDSLAKMHEIEKSTVLGWLGGVLPQSAEDLSDTAKKVVSSLQYTEDIEAFTEYASAAEAKIKLLEAEKNQLESRQLENEEKLTKTEQKLQFDETVRKGSKEVREFLDKKYPGMKSTSEQVRQALGKYPTLTPIEAFKLHYSEEIERHMTKKATHSKARVPDMVTNRANRSGGSTQPAALKRPVGIREALQD